MAKDINRNIPRVVLIGRPNVGKSTFFNKIAETKKAIVSTTEGSTRDVNETIISWRKATFVLVDTGGLDSLADNKNPSFAPKINREIANHILKLNQREVKSAALVLLLVDQSVGLTEPDRQLVKRLQQMKPGKVLLVVNKTDSFKQISQTGEFYKLGFEQIHPVSALRGLGLGDLLDVIVENIPIKSRAEVTEQDQFDASIAVVGKPNVGKSSLYNKIIGEEKALVFDLPHTTRGAQDTLIEYQDKKLKFIDTAGLAKKAGEDQLNKESFHKTMEAIDRADIALLVLDALDPYRTTDKKVAQKIIDSYCSIIFVVNKWDMVEDKTTKSQAEYKKTILGYFPFLTWAPFIFTSAKTGQGTENLMKAILDIEKKKRTVIPELELKIFLAKAIKHQHPFTDTGTRIPKIYDLTQYRTNPPHFIVRIRPTDRLSAAYLRYLENQLRRSFDFEGVRIKLSIKK